MLHHLSWAAYLKGVAVLLIIYYAFIFLKYFRKVNYRPQNVLPALKQTPAASTASHREEEPFATRLNPESSAGIEEAGTLIAEADQFILLIKRMIGQASEKPLAADVLRLNLKSLVRDNPSLRTSPHRPAINELMVSECARTGTAELSEEEVDLWWEGHGDQSDKAAAEVPPHLKAATK